MPRTHLVITKQRTVIDKAKLTLIAAIVASSIALPAAALAQSAYTTGTAVSDAAGYPSPYGSGSGFYAYAPADGFGRSAHGRSAQRLGHGYAAPRAVER